MSPAREKINSCPVFENRNNESMQISISNSLKYLKFCSKVKALNMNLRKFAWEKTANMNKRMLPYLIAKLYAFAYF